MKTTRLLLVPCLLAFALASCASQKADQYDTSDPYGTADAGQQVNPPADAAANPIYDTPAAYEESTQPSPGVVPEPEVTQASAAPAAPANGAAIIHTVVAGDTLSGISSKYKVPMASIRKANNMTSDVVVLGRKMVIPPQ